VRTFSRRRRARDEIRRRAETAIDAEGSVARKVPRIPDRCAESVMDLDKIQRRERLFPRDPTSFIGTDRVRA